MIEQNNSKTQCVLLFKSVFVEKRNNVREWETQRTYNKIARKRGRNNQKQKKTGNENMCATSEIER